MSEVDGSLLRWKGPPEPSAALLLLGFVAAGIGYATDAIEGAVTVGLVVLSAAMAWIVARMLRTRIGPGHPWVFRDARDRLVYAVMLSRSKAVPRGAGCGSSARPDL